jgi:hypothetical protein
MNQQESGKGKVSFSSLVEALASTPEGAKIKGLWEVECYGADGKLKWKDNWHNIIVNAGLDHILSVVLAAGTQITSWYLLLTNSSPTVAAADTMASHSGWVENTNYSEGARQAFTPGSVSGQSVDNSASKATFSINATTTVGGACLTSVSTKGDTTGTLFAGGAFSGGNRSLISGDTLKVQATYTQADDGV